jgi:hypothetical protein
LQAFTRPRLLQGSLIARPTCLSVFIRHKNLASRS